MKSYILSLDQGTTSSRAVLVDEDGRIVGQAQKEFPQIYPAPGWVEHDALTIWDSQLWAAREVMKQVGAAPQHIKAIGIANQRETVVVWNRHTGQPVSNAVVWQCRRTAPLCDELKSRGLTGWVKEKTGLVIDPYFSATKIAWILENVPGATELARQGDLLAGTIDTWLMWKLTEGAVHATDVSNASRTMLFNIHSQAWDEELLDLFAIPKSMLPTVYDSSGYIGTSTDEHLGAAIPICGVAGDQQAALFGQACFQPGMAKATYGTGAFLLMHTGVTPIYSKHGLLTTIAWRVGGKVEYALEGSVFVAGALVQWLRDEMGLVQEASETEVLAGSIEDSGGVYVIPAFVGLGAPYWDEKARGAIVGLTRGTGRRHVVRAALEAIAFQVKDVLTVMSDDLGHGLKELRVDGGAAANNFLMQFQADQVGVTLKRPAVLESTAYGAAMLAGLGAGIWSSQEDVAALWGAERLFTPSMEADQRDRLYAEWKKAVSRVR